MGTLYVVGTPIGNLSDMTPRAVDVLRSVSLIAAEDTRQSAKLARAFAIDTPMVSYHQHNRASRETRILDALAGGDVAIVSDAGTPGIADPGHDLVVAAIAAGHTVTPVPGPSSVIAAVCASGIVPGPFVFLGFIERSGEARRQGLGRAAATGWPFVLFESPLRTGQTLRELNGIAPGRVAVVARELTKLHEEFARGPLESLANTYAEDPPRGEVVIVVGGAVESARDTVDTSAVARSILAQGVKPSKAARELSAITGIDRAEAYALVTKLVRDEAGS